MRLSARPWAGRSCSSTSASCLGSTSLRLRWASGRPRGPEAVALSYLSQGLPGFRGDIPEWSYQQAFHAKAVRGLQILPRYWWPRFVARIGQHGGHGCIETVSWVDEPCDTPRGFSRLRGRPSCLNRPLRRGPTPHRHRRAQGRNKKAERLQPPPEARVVSGALRSPGALALRSKESWASGLTEPRHLPKLLGNRSRGRVRARSQFYPHARIQGRPQRRRSEW
jgi:hypothetical protein